MPIVLHRIDDRLIHGQVVVGWGQPLDLGFIVLVDDVVAAADWEQELYRMGVPPDVDVYFASVSDAAHNLGAYASDPRPGILLTGTVEAMLSLVQTAVAPVTAVNVGGIHHREDRVQKLRYVFLNEGEARALTEIASHGVAVTAQDLPSARPLSLADILRGGGS